MSIRNAVLVLAVALSIPLAARAGDDCHGLKSAHCFCQVQGGTHMTTGNPDGLITVPGWEGKELFTYRIPNKCVNQQKDWADYHFDQGCWRACRDAAGVEGHTPDPEFIKLKAEAGKRLRAAGFCGGWMSAPSLFKAGTNKYRTNTGAGLGVGIGGTVRIENGKKVCK